MAQSTEYPDLKFVTPKSWTRAGRTSVQVIVIHDTEGSETIHSAEDGAAYDQHRTDGTSTHYFHDPDSTVQCVLTKDIAHAARAQGNKRGIQHELCGKAGQGAAGWADAASTGVLARAAKQVARDCKKWGIPVVKLTPAQVAAGTKGICGHADITKAFPQDKGTHTDPGPTFPWASFISQVKTELSKLGNSSKENNVTLSDADAHKVAVETFDYPTGQSAPNSNYLHDWWELYGMVKDLTAEVAEIKALLSPQEPTPNA